MSRKNRFYHKKDGKQANEKGTKAEDLVEKSLTILKKSGLFLGFIRAKKSGQFDEEGIDFLIILKSGLAFPLQVKASYHNHGHFQKHPFIKFIVHIEAILDLGKSIEKEIIDIINKAIQTTESIN